MSFCVKIIYESEMRKLTSVPETLSDLKLQVENIYGTKSYKFKYMDEEGDFITIGSDEELQEAYSVARSYESPSLKITVVEERTNSQLISDLSRNLATSFFPDKYQDLIDLDFKQEIPVWSIDCAACGKHPIEGIRFFCPVCENFNVCGVCESSLSHQHPVVKVKDYQKASWVDAGMISSYVELKHPNMALLEEVNLAGKQIVKAGSELVKIWKVQNNSQTKWREGCVLELTSGNFNWESLEVPNANPSEVVELGAMIKAPLSSGVHSGTFRLVDAYGNPFGDALCVNLQVESSEEAFGDLEVL